MGWTTRSHRRTRATSRSDQRRSGFEVTFEAQLKAGGVEYTYEKEPLYFTPPAKRRRKTFDWFITTRTRKEIIVETKGWWEPKARLAELEAIRQNPDRDIRYVFESSRKTITSKSRTTYADVCQKESILYSDLVIPQEWLDE